MPKRRNTHRLRDTSKRFAKCVLAVALGAWLSVTQVAYSEQPYVLETTELGRAAAALPAGRFVRLETTLPPGISTLRDLLRVRFPDGRAIAIHDWSDTGHWDPERQILLYLGMRRFKKFIAYDAQRNAWKELDWKGDAPPIDEKVGHTYGRNALDRKRGHLYHLAIVDRRARGLFRYLINEDRWERLPDLPSPGYPSVAALSIEWHPTLDKLIVLDPSHPGHRLWSFDGKRWQEMPRSSVSGYHSHLQYNDIGGDILLAGGNRSPFTVELLDKAGVLHRLPDAPFKMGIGTNDLTYDPQSGRYLYIRTNEKEIWELDGDTGRWRRAADKSTIHWPTGSGDLGVPIPVEPLGVIFLLHDGGPFLYRHDPNACTRTICPSTTN